MLTQAQIDGTRPHPRMITCARCGAQPLAPCITRTGHRTSHAHAVRREAILVWWQGWDAANDDRRSAS